MYPHNYPLQRAAAATCPSSPINAPEANDTTFVADCGSGLDTGCTFRGSGPLVIKIPVGRVVGDVAKLKDNNLISKEATVQLPAFDIDYFGSGNGINPERDRILFNGQVVSPEFLTGDNNVWKLNEFSVPIEWVNFPSDPGSNQTPTPVDNTIEIQIDTANTNEVWCTAIDWSAITIDVARPVVMAHGILSDGSAWNGTPFSWVTGLNDLGIPNSNSLNMGNLDSIQNNAGKIGNEISKSKDRWGVDKVNIVAHSKGGLDSRHFVENDDSVERVIQLGTPNAGSPLADLAQGLIFAFTSLPTTVFVNSLAGPAGVQLTRPYMAYYNRNHGHNSKVTYTAVAGDYSPDCFFCINRLLLAITGKGDTIVPVTSVHALGYTDNRIFATSGNDIEATHTSIEKSSRVFDIVQDQVQTMRAAAINAAPIPIVARTLAVTGIIHQGETITKTIPIDQATPTLFSMLYPSGDLNLALISPSEQRFDASTVIGNPDVIREESEILGGRMEAYSFANLEIGLWTVEVSAPSVTEPSGSVSFGVNGWLENPVITFSGGFGKANVHFGETIKITGTVKNNSNPVLGVNVVANIILPDNTTETVAMHDDGLDGDVAAGDGIYSANYNNTALSGIYKVHYAASHDISANLPAFSREDFLIATVSVSTSTIVGQFADSVQDSDGDGLFNSLDIDVVLNITETANYRVLGILEDSNGNSIEASSVANLNPGANTVTLNFDGEEIYKNHANGPYKLKTVRLSEEGNLETMLVDEYTTPYSTAAYDYQQFQHPTIVLTGVGSANGVDTDNNGLFNLLNVNLEVDVVNAGTYTWSARLVDSNGTEIGFYSSSGALLAGKNSIEFSFDGNRIGENGVDGPYSLRGLIMFGAGKSVVISNAFTTSDNLNANQFEGHQITNHPPIANAGPDQTLECTGNNSSSVTLDGSGSSDPDGDLLSYSWSGAFDSTTGQIVSAILPLGFQTVTLSVDDGKGGTNSDTVDVTVTDTQAPKVSVALVNVGKIKEKKGIFRVEYGCTELCGSVKSSTAMLNNIPVKNGQLVKLVLKKKAKHEYEKGLLEIEAPSYSLVATCIDSSGKVAKASATPIFKKEHHVNEK
jgi:hypothetical protein